MTKIDFLQYEFPRLLGDVNPATRPAWGKLSLQGMTEHMADSVRIANGRDPKDCITPPEHLPKMLSFLQSDKPFRENTVNPQMSEMPTPLRFDNMDDAIGELQMELNDFVDVFEQDKTKVITNPFYGDLNFDDWTQLLYKHALHHLRQFGVIPEPAESEALGM